VFCLLIVLVKLSLLAKWLARKTPLRNPNGDEGIISIKSRPKRAYDCVGLLYSFEDLFWWKICTGVKCILHKSCWKIFQAKSLEAAKNIDIRQWQTTNCAYCWQGRSWLWSCVKSGRCPMDTLVRTWTFKVVGHSIHEDLELKCHPYSSEETAVLVY